MWNDVTKLDKYEYVRTNAVLVRAVGIYGVFALTLMATGFLHFIKLHWIYALVFGPIVLCVLINKFLRYGLQVFYPKFDIKKHEAFIQKYWSEHPEPAVDIFLPYAGEDLNIHEKVVAAAQNIDYTNYKVYMLDDSKNAAHKLLAEKYGCTYLSRPNKGEWKKSGNLEFGYSKSTGKYILVLDADFIPSRDSLREIVPYLESDQSIGILQTPQYFEQTDEVHKRSPIEFGGGNIVEDFYRLILPSRDEFGAAMCVGTSAFYRREAIEKLDGTPKVHASEDLATGLLITQHGYRVKYLPLIVSIGTSPDTFQGYYKQHQRWCSGNLVFAKYWPNAQLNPVARLIYLMNPSYYLAEAFSILFSFQFLVLIYFHSDSLSLHHTILFLPYMFLNLVVIPLSRVNKEKQGTKLAALNNSYTYLHTFISLLMKNIPQWHPTGIKLDGLDRGFLTANKIGLVISSVFITAFTFVVVSRSSLLANYNSYFILFWGVYTMIWHTVYLTVVGNYIHPIQMAKVRSFTNKARLYARTHAVLVLFMVFSMALMASVFRTAVSPQTLREHLAQQSLPDLLSPTVTTPPDVIVPAVLSATVEETQPELAY